MSGRNHSVLLLKLQANENVIGMRDLCCGQATKFPSYNASAQASGVTIAEQITCYAYNNEILLSMPRPAQ
jgi:hypothetical protein